MSISAIAWAFNQQVGNPLRKLILVKIADNANDQGLAWPSIQTIAKQTEMSRDSVMRHIKELEKAGFLKTIRRKKNGVNLPNHYLLNIEGGVVQQRDYPPQSAGGSSTVLLPVVAQCNHNRHIEPSLETTHTNTNSVVSLVKDILNSISDETLKQSITATTVKAALKAYNPEAHSAYQPETPAQGVKRILNWMQHIQMPDSPAGFLIRMARHGMDKPSAVVRAEQAEEAERLERVKRERERERLKAIKNERMTDEERVEIKKLIASITKTI